MKNKQFVAVCCLLVLPVWGMAQSFLFQEPPAANMSLELRYLRPQTGGNHFNDRDLSLLSGLYELSFSFRVGGRCNLIVSAPFMAYASTYRTWRGEQISESRSGLGNVSVGLQYLWGRTAENRSSITAVVCLPTLANERETGGNYGYDSEYAHMSDMASSACYPDFTKTLPYTSLYVRAGRHGELGGGWRFDLEGGTMFMLPKGDGNIMTFLTYGASASHGLGPVELKVGLMGNIMVGGFVDEIYISPYYKVAAGLQWMRGAVRPGIFYAIKLGSYTYGAERGVLGFVVQVDLK